MNVASTDTDVFPSVAYGKGLWVVAWQSSLATTATKSAIRTSVSLDFGSTWGTPGEVDGSPVENLKPVILFDQKTNFVISFLAIHAAPSSCTNSYYGIDQDVFFTHSIDGFLLALFFASFL